MEVVSSHKSTARNQDIIKSHQTVKSTSAIEKVMPQSSYMAFDKDTHKPPRIDKFGYNKETHKGRELLNRNAKNILTEDTRIPHWWGHKKIRDSNFGQRSGSQSPTSNEEQIWLSSSNLAQLNALGLKKIQQPSYRN